MTYRRYEQGVTSIIIVMFSILLLVTMTVSFMQIMLNEQIRTNDTELSQGAYDSALAGVEDGKRALAACAAAGYNPAHAACAALSKHECTTVQDAGLAAAENGEVIIKTSTSGSGRQYQQAYTCVKVYRQTRDYIGMLGEGASAVVPLKATAPFEKIRVYWRVPNTFRIDSSSAVADVALPMLSMWGSGLTNPAPAMMRTQFIQYSSGTIAPDQFDGDGGRTVYLYPKRPAAIPAPVQSVSLAVDSRRSGTLQPSPVLCSPTAVNDGYHCMTELTSLPGDAASRVAYARLTSLYAGAEFKIRLIGATGEVVEFDGVQPSVDATGRAADVFRRVDARVELMDPNDTMLYPRATVDITKNFCKTFTVSASTSDYDDGYAVCRPTLP